VASNIFPGLALFVILAGGAYAEDPWSIHPGEPVTIDALFPPEKNAPVVRSASSQILGIYYHYMDALDFGNCGLLPSNEDYFPYVLDHYGAIPSGLMMMDRILRCSNVMETTEKALWDPPVFVYPEQKTETSHE